MIVLITGAKGMLGQDLVKTFKGETLLLPDEVELDITNKERVLNYIALHKPQWIINAAALTNVDACEEADTKALAMEVNGRGPGYLAQGAELLGAKMVQISTDYVFKGDKQGFYAPEDSVDPINAYGESKLLGEEEVLSHCSRAFVLRTAWLFGLGGNNFVKTILKLGAEREELTVVDDQFGSPTYTLDLARSIKEIVQGDHYGIYHVTNSGYCSWYEFAKLIVKQASLKVKITPVSSKEYQRPAKRPSNSRMDGNKLRINGYSVPREYGAALASFLEELEAQKSYGA